MFEMMTIGNSNNNMPSGQEDFTSPGVFTFVVPAGISVLKIVAIGAGGGAGIPQRFGTSNAIYQSGSGGSVAWSNNVPVSPGQELMVVVGAGFDFLELMSNPSQIRRGPNSFVRPVSDSTPLVLGAGGDNLSTSIGEQIYLGGSGVKYTVSSPISDARGGNSATFFRAGENGTTGSWWAGDGVNLKGQRVAASYSDPGQFGGGAQFYSNTRRLGASGNGAIRIMWDAPEAHQRSFPSDIADV